MTRIARHVRVTGRVQGVFFRQSTAEKANEIGVSGWVRNCPDGSVEAHVEGIEPAIRSMIEWMEMGPPAASVVEVDAQPVEPRGLTGFEARW